VAASNALRQQGGGAPLHELQKPATTYRVRVFMSLREAIRNGVYPVGGKLPSIRKLSTTFHASITPVHEALVLLEREGYVERCHGSGVYVRSPCGTLSLHDHALLCMDATGHIFSDLATMLHQRLHDCNLLASILDTRHAHAADLLRRAQYSEWRFLLCHASHHFPFDVLDANVFIRRHLIAVVSWESTLLLDRVHRILVDHAGGSRLLVDHLWECGHRRLLLAGPSAMFARADQWDGRGRCPLENNVQLAGFARMWRWRGGSFARLECYTLRPRTPPCFEEHDLGVLSGPDAPTAVVGIRDVDAWSAQETIRGWRPSLLRRLVFLGNGDTPWSQTSHPPFTTLDWNLAILVDHVTTIIGNIVTGKRYSRPTLRLVTPRLVVRG